MSENTRKNVDMWYKIVQGVLAILLIANLLVFIPIRKELDDLSECIIIIERTEIPNIRREQSELRAQLREHNIRYNNLASSISELKDNNNKSFDELKAGIEYIRKRMEQ